MNKIWQSFCILFFISYSAYAHDLVCPPVDAEGKLRNDDKAFAILDQCLAKSPITKSLYFDEKSKRYTNERQRLHDKMVADVLANKPCRANQPIAIERQRLHDKMVADVLANKPCRANQPIAILTGGLPGSGKTTFLKKHLPWINAQQFVVIDLDSLREKFPEYNGWNATNTQAEGKDVVHQILSSLGKPCKYNLFYDSSMSNEPFFEDFIQDLKGKDYKIFIIYMQTPLKVAIERAKRRYLVSGRYVPAAFMQEVKTNSMKTFDKIKNQVDGYVIVDGVNYKVVKQHGEKMSDGS